MLTLRDVLDWKVMDRLLNSGASLHAVNQDGNTALHLAAFNNHLGAMGLLLKWGAKTDMRNADGLVPVSSFCAPGSHQGHASPCRHLTQLQHCFFFGFGLGNFCVWESGLGMLR